jgi:hypothetical protein
MCLLGFVANCHSPTHCDCQICPIPHAACRGKQYEVTTQVRRDDLIIFNFY